MSATPRPRKSKKSSTRRASEQRRDNTLAPVKPALWQEVRDKVEAEYQWEGELNIAKIELAWHDLCKAKKIRHKEPPDQQTLRNFRNEEPKARKYWLIDGLCQLLLGCSLEEWEQLHQQAQDTSLKQDKECLSLEESTDRKPALQIAEVSPTSYEEVSSVSSEVTKSTPDSRLNQLEQLRKDSKARCIERWQGVGVGEKEAEELADDPSVGVPPPHIQLCAEKLILLIGEVGAGKSLIAERLFQSAIQQARDNANAPVPVYLEAKKVVGHLQEAVEAAAIGIGNPQLQGATVIIDGADEAGTGLASQLLTEARRLRAWQKTTVIITSRPIPTFDKKEEAVQVPLLSLEDACTLIERFAKQPITGLTTSLWSESIKDAVRLPLFALLMVRYLRERDNNPPTSTGELLDTLVEQVKADRSTTDKLLKRLAILSIESGYRPVRATDVVPTKTKLQPLLDSGLVIERAGGIAFPLRILSEWFAAQSLIDDDNPKVEDFVSEPEQLEYWRYPLIIATATCGYDLVSRLLTPIVEIYPAFAAEIVKGALVRRGLIEEGPQLPYKKCGQQIRTAMQAWVNGIGSKLALLIAPVRENGTLLPIGVRTDGAWLDTAWYVGESNSEDSSNLKNVVKLPADFDDPESPEWNNWNNHSGTRSGLQSAWAWKWALDILAENLSRSRAALIVPDGSLAHEAAWQAALAVTKRSSWSYDPIPCFEIEQRLSEIEAKASQSVFISLPEIDKYGTKVRQYYLDQLGAKLERFRLSGETEFCYLWPHPDQVSRGGKDWEQYTPEQLRVRAKAVYKGALDGYQELVNVWFPRLKPNLQMAALLPVRFVGVIILREPDQSPWGNPPTIRWYLEPLPEGEPNDVDISFGEHDIFQTHAVQIRSASQKLQALRPESASWVSKTRCLSEYPPAIFGVTPVSKLVYSWLWKDLRRVSWVKIVPGDNPW
jgi:hypothetical protein